MNLCGLSPTRFRGVRHEPLGQPSSPLLYLTWYIIAVDIRIQIAEMTAGYLTSRERQLSSGAMGVDEYVNRWLRLDLEMIGDPTIPPEEKAEAYRRVVVAGLFEESLFSDFPGLRPK